MLTKYIGKIVIVRDHMAGVFIGTLAEVDLTAGTWTLKDARKIHYWAKAAAVAGLATTGDNGSGGRVCPLQAMACGRALVEVVPVTGGETLLSAPVWAP